MSQNLDWSTHIESLKRKLSRNIGILSLFRKQLPFKVLKILYYSLIHSHLHYMLLIWGHDSDIVLKKQKQALRIIFSKHCLSHSDPLFKSINALKINDLHTQVQLKFCHKYIHRQLPDYL